MTAGSPQNLHPKPPRRTTLKDVARLCGVTSMTVSKYLNNKGVAAATARKIQVAIEQLNYTPNLVAKSLRLNRTHTIGVVVSDSSQLLLSRMLKGIDDEAFISGYNIIMANTNQNAERERECIVTLLNKRIDGIILAAPKNFDVSVYNEIARLDIPAVLLMRPTDLPVDSVCCDNFRAARAMVEHLLSRGARDIRFISLPRYNSNGKERLNGYRQTMLENGLPVTPEKVAYAEPTIASGEAAMRAMLDAGFAGDAVFCGCDMIAVGALRAARKAGLRIPEDVRVCGFDDIEMVDNLAVPLTTIRQPVYDMGQEGMRLILRRLRDPSVPSCKGVLPCELIVREST